MPNKILRRHGDQIERLPNGYFKAHGRIDDSMNLGGIKVSSTQIEELVNSLDSVKESAAIAVPPPGGGPSELTAFLVMDKEVESEELLKELRLKIKNELNPLFKLQKIFILEQLTRTASNKIIRRHLREIALKSFASA